MVGKSRAWYRHLFHHCPRIWIYSRDRDTTISCNLPQNNISQERLSTNMSRPVIWAFRGNQLTSLRQKSTSCQVEDITNMWRSVIWTSRASPSTNRGRRSRSATLSCQILPVLSPRLWEPQRKGYAIKPEAIFGKRLETRLPDE